MSETARQRWDRVHADGDEPPDTFRASPFLDAWLPTLPDGGRALDVACGAGRNALRLAEAGYRVDAVDISTVGLDHGRSEADRRGLDVNWVVADLDEFVPERAAYDVVVVVRFEEEVVDADPDRPSRTIALQRFVGRNGER